MADLLPSDEISEEPSDYGSLRPGTPLGRYELLVPIARGGMARVWAARLHGQRGFQKIVAIKTILPHLADEPEFERMFLDEARIASGVHHPNVCEIYELGEEHRILYLAMEWVTGDSFSRVLRPGGKLEAIDPRVAARVVADAAAGLHAAHELTDDSGRSLGVVHRDLSPHNILLTADGVAKVADFGVAKALGQLHEATSAGQLKGKISYMSPEQITGTAIDRRSDLFALGCVLYEATTGERPFKGDGDAQVMHAILRGELVRPSALVPSYPTDLERIILRALSPQPDGRFASAEELRFALEEFLARGPLVTQSNVAQVVRARIGAHIERRKERIRQASNVGDHGAIEQPGSARDPHGDGQRSGVKPAPRPMYATMPLDQPAVPLAQLLAARGAHPPPDAHAATAHAPQAMGAASPYTPSPYSPYTASHAQSYSEPRHSPGPPPFGPNGSYSQPGSPPLDSHADQSSSHAGYAVTSPSYAAGSLGPQSHRSGADDRRPSAPPAPAQYFLAAAIGVVFAAMIGVGGFLIWASQQARGSAAAATAPVSAPTTTPVATSSGTSSPAVAAAATPEVAFRITPADARIVIDGRELAPDVRSIPRPKAGATVAVVVRAAGHDERALFVDHASPSSVEVTLAPHEVAGTPNAPVDAPAGAGGTNTEGPAAEPPKTDPPSGKPEQPKPKPRPKVDPASLPANPY